MDLLEDIMLILLHTGNTKSQTFRKKFVECTLSMQKLFVFVRAQLIKAAAGVDPVCKREVKT